MKRALLACALALGACGRAGDAHAPPGGYELAPADLPAFFDCLRENGFAAVSAHRGGPAAGAPENSLAAMARTMASAPALLEVDVARTRDGVLVLMHDETIDRTTTGTGRVRDLTLREIQMLRLRDETGAALDARVPTLREALDWARGRAVLELDVKRGVSYEEAAREVEAAGAMGRAVFITYGVDGAARLARVAPEAMIYTTINSTRDLDELEQRGVDLTRIVAWTGARSADTALNRALAARGVEARLGMFGTRRRGFAGAVHTGVSVIAVDAPAAATRELDAADGVAGHGVLTCAR